MIFQSINLAHLPQKTAIDYWFIFGLLTSLLFNASLVQSENSTHNVLKYQQAAIFSNLNWHESLSERISVELAPIKNYSGIPFEDRVEKSEYFYYGKLPKIMNNIFTDAFFASHYFMPTESNADYHVELILQQYKLPFNYEADDSWWEKLQGQTDRWLQSPSDTGIKLTIKLTSGNKKIKPWMESVEMLLSECDLNARPQPLTWLNNQNQLVKTYLSTTPGQTFLAATNFLLLKTIQRLNQQPLLASVKEKFADEIYLTSQTAYFTQGELLDLYYQHPVDGKSELVAGQVRVIKAQQNHATAYPVNLKSAHIKVGDWVEMQQTNQFEQPQSTFSAVKQCAKVIQSQAIQVTSIE